MPGRGGDLEAYDLLDDEDPFEIDDQIAHLFKHPGLSVDDALDVFASDPIFYPAEGPGGAEWLMVAEVAGEVLQVPLAPSNYSGPTRMRPLGVYRASAGVRAQFELDRRLGHA